MELVMATREASPFYVVEVSGEIDVATAPKFKAKVVEAIDAGHTHLVIDIQNVAFLDSTGLGVLVGALKRVRAHGGSLDIVCTSERLMRIFKITGLDKVFGLHASLDEVK